MRLAFLIGSVLPACGGGSSGVTTDNAAAARSVAGFEGIESIEQTPDDGWLLKWPVVDFAGVIYSIFSGGQSAQIDFDSPVRSVTSNFWKYEPTNIFEEPVCFVVRVQNLKGDSNTKSLCTTQAILDFSGANALDRQVDGSYVLKWKEIQLAGVIYTIFERASDDEYTFEQASYDGIKDNFYKLPRAERGLSRCYIVRFAHPRLPADLNTNELCTETERPIDFAGIGGLDVLSATSVRVSWLPADATVVRQYKVYQGSDFKELLATVDDGESASVEIRGLVPGRQYNFGVRAVDDIGREDRNTRIRPIIMPAE